MALVKTGATRTAVAPSNRGHRQDQESCKNADLRKNKTCQQKLDHESAGARQCVELSEET